MSFFDQALGVLPTITTTIGVIAFLALLSGAVAVMFLRHTTKRLQVAPESERGDILRRVVEQWTIDVDRITDESALKELALELLRSRERRLKALIFAALTIILFVLVFLVVTGVPSVPGSEETEPAKGVSAPEEKQAETAPAKVATEPDLNQWMCEACGGATFEPAPMTFDAHVTRIAPARASAGMHAYHAQGITLSESSIFYAHASGVVDGGEPTLALVSLDPPDSVRTCTQRILWSTAARGDGSTIAAADRRSGKVCLLTIDAEAGRTYRVSVGARDPDDVCAIPAHKALRVGETESVVWSEQRGTVGPACGGSGADRFWTADLTIEDPGRYSVSIFSRVDAVAQIYNCSTGGTFVACSDNDPSAQLLRDVHEKEHSYVMFEANTPGKYKLIVGAFPHEGKQVEGVIAKPAQSREDAVVAIDYVDKTEGSPCLPESLPELRLEQYARVELRPGRGLFSPEECGGCYGREQHLRLDIAEAGYYNVLVAPLVPSSEHARLQVMIRDFGDCHASSVLACDQDSLPPSFDLPSNYRRGRGRGGSLVKYLAAGKYIVTIDSAEGLGGVGVAAVERILAGPTR